MNLRRVAILGTLDVEGTGESIARLRIDTEVFNMPDARVVLPSGIPRSRNHGIARFDAQDRLALGGKNLGMMFRVKGVRLRGQLCCHQQE